MSVIEESGLHLVIIRKHKLCNPLWEWGLDRLGGFGFDLILSVVIMLKCVELLEVKPKYHAMQVYRGNGRNNPCIRNLNTVRGV